MRTSAVVIGGGHNGLAMSHRLTRRSIDHVVIERGDVAHSWRTQRWASLRLLTPNWQTGLPGQPYTGADPDGYMTMPEVAGVLTEYASAVAAPVRAGTTVLAVRPAAGGFDVVTDHGTWRSAVVVVASGWSSRPAVPPAAAAVPDGVRSLSALDYRSPDDLDERGVLVVGASATGVQLADELRRSGRAVTIAVGEHVRLPRTYRGRDVMWWLDAAGILDERYDAQDDLVRARRLPSPQLIGSPERRTVDLPALARLGVRMVGRVTDISGGVVHCSGGLDHVCRLADLKLGRLLDRLDAWAAASGVDGDDGSPRPEPFRPPADAPLGIDLRRGEIGTILWATGFRPDHSWIELPVFDRHGRLRHDGGVVAPGCYVLGGNLLRRRRSSYISGAAGDTADLADHVHHHLDTTVGKRGSRTAR